MRKRNTYYGAYIYVIRTGPDGSLKNARPCMECVNAMKSCGIKRVYYSTKDGTITMEKVEKMEFTYLSHAQQRRLNCGTKYWKF